MIKMVRFLHAADLHLDSPFKGLSDLPNHLVKMIRNSTFEAFNNMITYAIEQQVDMVLIVGDIYDGENRSLQAQKYFVDGMQRLQKANIRAVISYGNHDHLGGKWVRFNLPSNVDVLGNEVETKKLHINDEVIYIHGFSYPERHIKQKMIDEYPVAQQNGLHIGMLHGSLAGDESHDVYAPFTKQSLLNKKYHYWALGHIHKRQILHETPPIIYPGNIQSRHRKEQGEKGFYDVHLQDDECHYQFIRAEVVRYEQVVMDGTPIRYANDVTAICHKALQTVRSQGAAIVELRITNLTEEGHALWQQTSPMEWLALLRESEADETPMVWVASVTCDAPKEALTKASEQVLALIDDWDEERWQEVLGELYQQANVTRFLPQYQTIQIDEMKAQVKETFLQTMRNK